MARPPKIQEETKTYSLLMTVEQYDKLANISSERQKTELEQVSVADLIRESIDLYIHVVEQENEEETGAD
jgi:predicted DNA-binding protein